MQTLIAPKHQVCEWKQFTCVWFLSGVSFNCSSGVVAEGFLCMVVFHNYAGLHSALTDIYTCDSYNTDAMLVN